MKGIKIDLHLELKDPSGKIVMSKDIPCHTFLKNFAEFVWLYLFMRGDVKNSATITKIGGTTDTIEAPDSGGTPFDYVANSNYKMKCRIGTGTQAFNRTDYDVQTYEDQLNYTQYSINDDGTQKTLTLSFSWLNDTGVSKDITEACLTVYLSSSSAVIQMALTRDVFTAVTVANGYTIAFGYTITFPW